MADQTVTVRGSGNTLGTLLFLVFLVLKLTGVIAWSWWWITAPLWIPFVLVLLAFSALPRRSSFGHGGDGPSSR